MNLQEFTDALSNANKLYDATKVEDYSVVFRGFDIDPADDRLEIGEFKEGYATYRENANDQEINDAFKKYDLNNDGGLDVEEFGKGLDELERLKRAPAASTT